MEILETLRHYGLFDAKVPRYTSYPPANRFQPDVGAQNLPKWLSEIPENAEISIYVHIPFCRRLCWFCACRTQGTKTLGPVENYLTHLVNEIEWAAALIPKDVKMARLHLGGGTPTLLNPAQMHWLLNALHKAFPKSADFEFSVEIDPTEAPEPVLDCLAGWNMNRASVGIQDFAPQVQRSIGRRQSESETHRVVDKLRENGLRSLNVDLLYGLPNQTAQTLRETVLEVLKLAPDRLALYGYAHVPHMSKRQVMIPSESLPSPLARYELAQVAHEMLEAMSYEQLGIDHYALPSDSLAKAAHSGRLHRNFQGYTDDPCDTLIGFGASAISCFPDGYSQNAVSTGAYNRRIAQNGQAAHKGVILEETDRLIAAMISGLMCYGDVNLAKLPGPQIVAKGLVLQLAAEFPEALNFYNNSLEIREGFAPLTRVLCARLDHSRDASTFQHSLAF